MIFVSLKLHLRFVLIHGGWSYPVPDYLQRVIWWIAIGFYITCIINYSIASFFSSFLCSNLGETLLSVHKIMLLNNTGFPEHREKTRLGGFTFLSSTTAATTRRAKGTKQRQWNLDCNIHSLKIIIWCCPARLLSFNGLSKGNSVCLQTKSNQNTALSPTSQLLLYYPSDDLYLPSKRLRPQLKSTPRYPATSSTPYSHLSFLFLSTAPYYSPRHQAHRIISLFPSNDNNARLRTSYNLVYVR